MTVSGGAPAAEPFFLPTASGTRFCLFHAPVGACRGAVLYVPPFAEEMNRSRRMAALQARALAALGYGVLQLDLHGCGDSSGEFGDASWDSWKQDLAAGAAWLQARLDQPLILWGLRLGVLLALDYARSARHPVASMLLWQPVLSAPSYLTQFLRLRVAGALLGEDGVGAGQQGTSALRATLQGGQAVEVAGYRLAPALATAMDTLALLDAMPPSSPVSWFESVAAGQEPSPRVLQAAAAWRTAAVDLQLHTLPCPPFWSTSEITVSPSWVDATCAALTRGQA